MPLRIDAYGPDALLVRHSEPGDALAFARGQTLERHLEERTPIGLLEVTSGFETLLLEFLPGSRPDPAALAEALTAVAKAAKAAPKPSRVVEIPVLYDGPDLERIAEHTKLKVDKVIQLHLAGEYRVHLLGFSPGFPYLGGLDKRLRVPRLDTPRPRVAAGSVGIGGEHTGVYPVATAGGWNLLGRTSTPLLAPERAVPGSREAFLLQPGDGVRFVRVERL